ncbi:MAG: glucose-1-phosphate thymidylyltransferase [Armatimonadota bacterium]|nr:MAG: glucose-1-phosphate thymidylyltransferase [Armatimonadota bacterium]
MKGVVLAGGRATRLRPLTHTMTKHLIPLANKPIIYYCLESLAVAGITEVAIIVGCRHPDYPGSIDTGPEIMEAVGGGERWGLKVTYVPQDAPRGIAHAVGLTRDFVGRDPFVVFLGDNFLPSGIADFTREFEHAAPNAMILLCRVPNPRDFGVAVLEGEHVTRLEEKPEHPPSDLALVGVYLFDHHVFDAIDDLKPSRRGELEITHAIQSLIDGGLVVRSHQVKGWWKDTGTLSDLLEANRIVLDTLEESKQGEVDDRSQLLGSVVIEDGAAITNSIIQGPAIIGRNARVADSLLGPYVSIHFDVEIEGSELANSIVLEESAIRHIPGRIRDSLIGKNVAVHAADRRPGWHQFVLGDYSQVILT